MSEQNVKTRIVHKHDTEENWNKASSFIPKQAEIIVYDIDATHSYQRYKIGDGKTVVTELPFMPDPSQSVYIGATEPTDPNIKIWINTAEDSGGVTPLLPRIATITLPASGWTGNKNPYSQVVTINSATANSKIDLQPTAQQIVSLQNEDIALMAENSNGVVTVYALGGKPSVDYTMQVLLTEVAYV